MTRSYWFEHREAGSFPVLRAVVGATSRYSMSAPSGNGSSARTGGTLPRVRHSRPTMGSRVDLVVSGAARFAYTALTVCHRGVFRVVSQANGRPR
jgi:hypothetical protein